VPEAGILKIKICRNFEKNKCRISQTMVALVVNLVRTVPSGKFICCCWCNPWFDFHVTHTHTEM